MFETTLDSSSTDEWTCFSLSTATQVSTDWHIAWQELGHSGCLINSRCGVVRH